MIGSSYSLHLEYNAGHCQIMSYTVFIIKEDFSLHKFKKFPIEEN